VIAGETRGPSTVTKDWIEHVARMAIKDIGYEQDGFHWKNANIEVLLHPQSADIAQGVDAKQPDQQGRRRGRPGHHVRLRLQRNAGTDAGADLLRAQDPAPGRSRATRAREKRCSARTAKSQVTVRYENGKPVGVTQIVVSTQHLDENLTVAEVREDRRALCPQGAAGWLDQQGDRLAHQPDRRSYIGGPDGDCGLTGRKILPSPKPKCRA
jgi:S-adenosylmethionine synthetase